MVKILATSSLDDTVKILDANTGKLIHNLEDNIMASILLYSPDGKFLASMIPDSNSIIIWDAKTGVKFQSISTLQTPILTSLTFSDGQFLAYGTNYP